MVFELVENAVCRDVILFHRKDVFTSVVLLCYISWPWNKQVNVCFKDILC